MGGRGYPPPFRKGKKKKRRGKKKEKKGEEKRGENDNVQILVAFTHH